MHTSMIGKVASMPRKYDEKTKARAVRLVVDHVEDYDSEWEATKTVAARLGVHPETLRKWIRQAEVDAGDRDGVTTSTALELRELKRKRTPNWSAPLRF